MRFDGNTICFDDGRKIEFDAVIFGTGYKPELNTILADGDDVLSEDGIPYRSGHEAAPGLYFCGFYVSPTGMLREIGKEAGQIATEIANRRS